MTSSSAFSSAPSPQRMSSHSFPSSIRLFPRALRLHGVFITLLCLPSLLHLSLVPEHDSVSYSSSTPRRARHSTLPACAPCFTFTLPPA